MVRANQDASNRIAANEKTAKSQMSVLITAILVTSLFAPSMSLGMISLEPDQPRSFTANNTTDEAATQALLSNLNTSNPIEVTGIMDDQGRVHLVWIENGTSPMLQYALISTNGIDTVLIANTLVGQSNYTEVSSPSMVLDSDSNAHIVWAITDVEILYSILDPSEDDQDGSTGDVYNMTLTSEYIIAEGTGIRNDPDIAVDSNDAMHIVWVDTYDPQGLYFGTPLIYYKMVAMNSTGGVEVVINNTLVTPALGYKGNPAVSIGVNNTVIVVWEDTRGSLIEYVGLLDTSGSMTAEWEDMCAVFYGGNLTSGEYFQGVKPLLESASITVLETLYALSGQMAHASNHKNCEDGYAAGGNGTAGPRTDYLGQIPTDNSGGIRALTEVVYNGSALSIPTDWGYYSEMWGPGSTWACTSWRDYSSMTPGNPPSSADHSWNPNATKLIIPVSDEGPYGGSGNGYEAQDADDNQSIREAHDACVNAGIIPIPVAGTTSYGANTIWANDTHVRSHMMDLAQCNGNFTGLADRTCDGLTTATKDAGGEMFLYPSDNMANFEGDFESGYLTNGWGASGSSDIWSVEAADNGLVYSQANLCDIGGTTGNPSFYSVSCNYTQPAGQTVDLTVNVDSWASEFSMDVILPDGTVASFNSSSVYNQYSGVLVSFTGAGNYTIFLNDTYGDGGTSVSADYTYVSSTNPSSTPISGSYSAQSGSITHSESTNLEFTGVLANGTVSFSYNVSSEAGYDFLKFYLDGIQLAQWSGTQNGNFSTPVSLGQHTLKWTYAKDGSVSSGNDAAWIDDVVIPVANYTDEVNALVQSIIALTTSSGSTETYLSVLDPYSMISNPRSTWSMGDPGHSVDPETGEYIEDTGPSVDYVWQDGIGWSTIGHLVIVNDTRLTNGHGWSVSPEVNSDDDGNVHIVWVDGRSEEHSRTAPSQLHYMQLDLSRAGPFDGEADGLDLSTVSVVSDSLVPGSDMTWGANPRVDFDNDGSVHVTWFESSPDAADGQGVVELRWTRITTPQLDQDGQLPLGQSLSEAYAVINTRVIAQSTTNLMGVFGDGISSGSQPIVNFDWPNRDIVWTTPECEESETVTEDQWDVCMWSENVYQMDLVLAENQGDEITLNPGEATTIDLVLRGPRVPGGSDIVIASSSEIMPNWFSDLGFSGNYQPTTTLVEDVNSELELFLRAPSLREANQDQSFEVTITVTSSTMSQATTSVIILVNLVNEGDWDDDDNDGIPDSEDDCQFGDTDWTSNFQTDHDSDGCQDSTEDPDDDNDGFLDSDDNCPSGVQGNFLDADNDGCDDTSEDPDNDGDGVENHLDLCPDGAQYWGDFAEDHDGDGCRDGDEDDNDDNDPFVDTEDDCPKGEIGWSDMIFDNDGDGCHDLKEDRDDDNDGILDRDDLCPQGMTVWFSEPTGDFDGDGCHDVVEDEDDDNDGVPDDNDQCLMGVSNWESTLITDWDSDGCHDEMEDADDDNDGVSDHSDECQRSTPIGPGIDLDLDGCNDSTEDKDLDNDGINTPSDNCEEDRTSDWVSTVWNDIDQDGCVDTDDWDDDNDGISDAIDECPYTQFLTIDIDRDGCMDDTEDEDDDNDGVPDSRDLCPTGITNWKSDKSTDIDGDGCMDSAEDESVPNALLNTITGSAFTTLMAASVGILLVAAAVMARRSRSISPRTYSDGTLEVESTMSETGSLEVQQEGEKEDGVRKLSDIGYSPEVAKAILDAEEEARRRRN